MSFFNRPCLCPCTLPCCSHHSVRRDGPFSQMDLVVTGFETFLIGPICDIAATLLFALDSSTTTTTNGTAWANLAQAVEQLKTTPPPDSPTRQFIVAWSVLTIGAFFFYFFFSGLNYYVVHRKCGNLKHKPFAGQVGAEIAMASKGNCCACLFLPSRCFHCARTNNTNVCSSFHSNSNHGFVDGPHCCLGMPRLLSIVWTRHGTRVFRLRACVHHCDCGHLSVVY